MAENFSISPSVLSELLKIRSFNLEESFKYYGGIEGLCRQLQTDLSNGIDDSPINISKRAKYFGSNKVPQKCKISLFECLKNMLTDYTLLLILVLSSLSIIIGVFAGTTEYIGNFKVLISVWILNAIYAVYEYKKINNFTNLEPLNWKVKVIRSGVEKEIFKNDLLVGDLLVISKGDVLQIDGILLKGSILQVKESKTQISNKTPIIGYENSSNPFLYFGTKILEGNGVILVLSVGKYPSQPEISQEEPDEEELSLVQRKIEEKAESWGNYGVISTIIIIFTLLILFFYHSIVEWKWGAAGTIQVLSIFVEGLVIIVFTIPDNFPACIIPYLSRAIKQVAKEKIFIKNLSQIEVIGEVTTMIISINSWEKNTESLYNLIQRLKNSGISIKVVTKESERAGKEIAESFGIIGDISAINAENLKNRVSGLTGILDFNKEEMDYVIKSFKNVAENIKVFANCTENDKVLIAKALKASGEIVASIETCDFDSSLLENSDVGISTLSSSQICIDASSVVLLESNYEIFMNALKRSRNIILSIRKLIVIRESCIFVLLSIYLICVFTSGKFLFNGVQLIWISFILDILGILAFTIEYPRNNELDTAPLKMSDEIVTRDMKIVIRAQIIYQTLVLVFLYLGNQNSLIFPTFVLLQIFNELSLINLNIKSIQAISIVLLSLIAHYLALEYAGSWLGTQKLSWEDHFYIIKLSASSLLAPFIAKILSKLSKKKEA